MLPSCIGPYRIVRPLGQGGMGAVYEAIHQTIERRVAIKVLHPEYAQKPDVIARFFNEARAVNRIEHPGLVQVSDYGHLPNGTAYIVMEFLKGESLGSRMRRLGGVLPVKQALNVAWQITDALVAAHAKNIVHRDLKPDNVMLVPDTIAPGGERAKLVDFGIAKLAEAAQTGQVRTRTDMVMGTPHYMAPEQCRGACEVDEKADVYSLGVMLYQLFCGHLPFEGEGTGEILAKHIYELPRPLQTVAPNIPNALAALVHALLEKQKDHRPAMSQVFGALGRMIADHGVEDDSTQVVPHVPSVYRSPGPVPQSTLGFSIGQNVPSTNLRRSAARVGLSLFVAAVLAGGGLISHRALRSKNLPPAPHAGAAQPKLTSTPKPVSRPELRSPHDAEPARANTGDALGKTTPESVKPTSYAPSIRKERKDRRKQQFALEPQPVREVQPGHGPVQPED